MRRLFFRLVLISILFINIGYIANSDESDYPTRVPDPITIVK